MVCYFMPVPCVYSGSTWMMTHNGVEKMNKMVEKVTQRRPQSIGKKRKKEAETGLTASQPAQAGPQAGTHPVPAGLPASLGRPPGRPPS